LNTIDMPDLSTRPSKLVVERMMESSPSLLFKAWTMHLDRWCAEPGTVLMKAEVNSVFFFYTYFEGKRHPHYGRFLKLKQDRLIEITWVTGDGGTKGAETVVTIEIEPKVSGTKLRLAHAGFPDEESRDGHETAWKFILENLDTWISELS
jgi:uncharacterized protein YndB with AHSA1/START domain